MRAVVLLLLKTTTPLWIFCEHVRRSKRKCRNKDIFITFQAFLEYEGGQAACRPHCQAQRLQQRDALALARMRGLIQHAVGQELSVRARKPLAMQNRQLRLALVIFGDVAVFQRSARVRLIHAYRQRVAQVLHRAVLAHSLKLVQRVEVALAARTQQPHL